MDYSEVNIDSLMNLPGRVPTDIYVHIHSHKYTRVFRGGGAIDIDRVAKYRRRGIQKFFILRGERNVYLRTLDMAVRSNIGTDQIWRRENLSIVDELSNQCLVEIWESRELNPRLYSYAESLVSSYVDLVNSNPHLLALMIQMAKDRGEFVNHSVATSVFSVLLARSQSNQYNGLIFASGMGGFLHDIGMVMRKGFINETSSDLAIDELEILRRHPVEGLLLADIVPKFPDEARDAIKYHHENWDGSGYPEGLSGDSIPLVARIVSIAEEFVCHTMGSPTEKRVPPTIALAIMEQSHKFDPELLSSFENLLKKLG